MARGFGKMLGVRIEVVRGDITTVDAEVLASAYLTSLRLCDDVDAASVAFPALSTGAFGFPLLRACQISVTTLLSADTHVDRCVLVAFDVKTKRFWERALGIPR